jgi:hypothetical protein
MARLRRKRLAPTSIWEMPVSAGSDFGMVMLLRS